MKSEDIAAFDAERKQLEGQLVHEPGVYQSPVSPYTDVWWAYKPISGHPAAVVAFENKFGASPTTAKVHPSFKGTEFGAELLAEHLLVEESATVPKGQVWLR